VQSAIRTFDPIVQAWFQKRFGRPAPIQEQGWPVISSGCNTLLCAPTGSGKTLAAFLWAINRLAIDAQADALREGVWVLYVSPLKALANDVRLNLQEPLDGVREAAAQLGATMTPITAAVRTGDTPASERSAMLRRPPHLLVTTPESLFILLTSSRFRDKLASIRWLIVDELHALAGNKRGVHLAITLERLQRLIVGRGNPPPVRIGLSATLNPIEELARFLSGSEVSDAGRAPRPCQIVRGEQSARSLDLQVLTPGPDLGPIATHEHWEAMYDRIAELIRAHRTTLVFTLSRRWAERLALALQKRLGAQAVMAHHSSLARSERLNAEQRLKRGELQAIVATASLELGIDIGVVDLVCQVDSPKSIAAAIQRIGRSGHALGQKPKGRFFAMTLDDLLECAAAVAAIRRGDLDEVEIPRGCLDVAAQQIVAIAAEEGEISEDELLRLLRGAYNFAELDPGQLRQLLGQMAAELPQRIAGAQPKIFYDSRAGLVRPRRIARLAAITSGGTIPESGNYDVVIEATLHKVGDVEEDFAQEATRDDIFALGSMPWRIRGISRGRLMVEPAPGMSPTLPFWQTEAAGRTPALSAAITRLRLEIARRMDAPAQARRFLIEQCALEEHAAEQAIDYVRRGYAALGAMPDQQTLVAERFFDGLGGTQIVIHSPLGMRLNRGFGLALRKRLCQSFDFEIQASATDDGVLLALHSRHSFPLEQIFHMLTPGTVRKAMVQAALAGPMFEVRFRHVATRALALMRSDKGRQVPPWITRLRAQELILAIFPGQQACLDNRPADIEIPDHFLVQEALRECCEESTDLTRLSALLRGIEQGRVRTVVVDSAAPSVFAQRLLLASDYAFLDDGERGNRRSRTVQMNRAMAEDVLRSTDLSALLAEEAVAQVVSEADGTARTRQARDADELFEMIRAHGAVDEQAIAARCAVEPVPLLSSLAAAARITRIRLPHRTAPVWIAAEDAPLYAAVYGLHLPADGGATDDGDAARAELIRRALRTSGPVTARELADSLGIAQTTAEHSLIALEAAGVLFCGRFTSEAEQWCDRYNLERIHRLTLEKVRAQAEPCTDAEYTSVCLAWHHIGGIGLPAGAEAVAAVLEQLAGMPFHARAWEQALLPARVPDYRPEQLDLLCLSGEFMWVAPPGAAVDDLPEQVAFVPRGVFDSLGWPLPANPADDLQESVLRTLREGGAQYLDQLAARAGLSERDTLRALWRLAAAGLATNDGFAPLRLMASAPRAVQALEPRGGHAGSRYDAGLRARLRSSLGGRWSAIGSGRGGAEVGEEGNRRYVSLLIGRYGILSREVVAASGARPWSELVPVLRRMEYAGQIRRGYFVRSLAGEQYASEEAIQLLRSLRNAPAEEETVMVLAAIDPANPFGSTLPGIGVAREPGNLIALAGGQPIAALAGRELLIWSELEPERFARVMRALLKMRPRIRLDRIDGVEALRSPRVTELAALNFHSDGHSLIYDGLPGPRPARAARAVPA
jgi:ATP-dependent Lhr-like helicase